MKDNVKAIGTLKLTLKKSNGNTEVSEYKNLVVTVGRNHIADQLSDRGEAVMSHMAIGTNSTTQVIGDTALGTELSRKALTSKTQGSGADAHKVTYIADWPPGEGTGSITEAGIFNSAAAGTMLTRTTFPVKNKSASDTLTIQWTISITG